MSVGCRRPRAPTGTTTGRPTTGVRHCRASRPPPASAKSKPFCVRSRDPMRRRAASRSAPAAVLLPRRPTARGSRSHEATMAVDRRSAPCWGARWSKSCLASSSVPKPVTSTTSVHGRLEAQVFNLAPADDDAGALIDLGHECLEDVAVVGGAERLVGVVQDEQARRPVADAFHAVSKVGRAEDVGDALAGLGTGVAVLQVDPEPAMDGLAVLVTQVPLAGPTGVGRPPADGALTGPEAAHDRHQAPGVSRSWTEAAAIRCCVPRNGRGSSGSPSLGSGNLGCSSICSLRRAFNIDVRDYGVTGSAAPRTGREYRIEPLSGPRGGRFVAQRPIRGARVTH